MRLQRILAVTRRLLQQFHRDRRTLALLFVAPLVILGLIGYLLRGGGVHPTLSVVNQDRGPIAAMIADRLLASDRVSAEAVDLSTASARLAKGETAGYVVIPDGFSRSVAAGTGGDTRLEIHLEGTQPAPSGAVLQAVNQAVAGAAAQGRGHPPTVSYLHGGASLDTLDYFGAAFIGLIVFLLVFVVTSVSFLRERGQGTLERLMASPVRRGEIVLGYMFGFGLVALVQGLIVLLFSLYVLRIHNEGNVAIVFLLETLLAIGAVNLGIFLSMFARTEFQAVQFIPLVLVPQILLSGVLFPISSEPRPLQYVSDVLPLTYAIYGIRDVMLKGADLTSQGLLIDIGVGLLFAVVTVALSAGTLRRRIA